MPDKTKEAVLRAGGGIPRRRNERDWKLQVRCRPPSWMACSSPLGKQPSTAVARVCSETGVRYLQAALRSWTRASRGTVRNEEKVRGECPGTGTLTSVGLHASSCWTQAS